MRLPVWMLGTIVYVCGMLFLVARLLRLEADFLGCFAVFGWTGLYLMFWIVILATGGV